MSSTKEQYEEEIEQSPKEYSMTSRIESFADDVINEYTFSGKIFWAIIIIIIAVIVIVYVYSGKNQLDTYEAKMLYTVCGSVIATSFLYIFIRYIEDK